MPELYGTATEQENRSRTRQDSRWGERSNLRYFNHLVQSFSWAHKGWRMENVLGIKLDSNHPGVTTQRVPPASYFGRKCGKNSWGETKWSGDNSFIIEENIQVLFLADHTFHAAANDRNHHPTWRLLWEFPTNTLPSVKQELKSLTLPKPRRGHKVLSTTKSGNTTGNFNILQLKIQQRLEISRELGWRSPGQRVLRVVTHPNVWNRNTLIFNSSFRLWVTQIGISPT